MSEPSLRRRILSGAVLWSAGLFVAAMVVATLVMTEYRWVAVRVHGAAGTHSLFFLIIVAGLLGFGLVHLHRALAPLERLRQRLGEVRSGREQQIGGTYPAEVQPLVDDLNGLLEHQDRAVRRALMKAGDLAHGLKTPLAVLTHEAERARREGHAGLAASVDEQVQRMQRQLDYHLAQARAAASGAASGALASVRDSADGLGRTLSRLHSTRGLRIAVLADPELRVRVQPEDLDEMLGNLMDNACKWTRTQVTVSAARAGGTVLLTVDDDGEGVDAARRESVLQRGVRADESTSGSGFGLAIVRELAELYGGSLALDSSPDGGLRAVLRLPSGERT